MTDAYSLQDDRVRQFCVRARNLAKGLRRKTIADLKKMIEILEFDKAYVRTAKMTGCELQRELAEIEQIIEILQDAIRRLE